MSIPRTSGMASAALLAAACAVGVASASVTTAPAPAAPQGPWGGVSNVSRSGSPSDDPRLAAAPTGSVTYA